MLLTFFSKSSELSQNESKPLISYDSTSKTNRLFIAIAHGLVALLKTQKFIFMETFAPVLEQHAMYYPKQLPQHIRKLCLSEQVEYLLVYTQPHREVLIPSLAYTLQQCTVDTICKEPAVYGNLLQQGNSISELRKNKHLDHPSILQALADKILPLNLYVERYPKSCLLPVKEYYPSETSPETDLCLHYQNQHYLCQRYEQGDH